MDELGGIVARLKTLKTYDISLTLESNMPGMVTYPSPGIVPDAKEVDYNYYFSQILVVSELNGTHVKAPSHIHRGAASIDMVPTGYLIGPYKKYDLTGFNPQAGGNITLREIEEVGARDGIELKKGDIVLLQFGWDKYYKPECKNPPERNWYAANVPGITEEAMRYFVAAQIRAIGSDAISTDTAYTNSKNQSLPGHEKYFLPNNILIMGSFVNLAAAPASGIFMAIPLKIKGGSGSPIRALLFA